MIYLLVDDLAGRARLAELEAALGDPGIASLNTSRFEGGRVELSELSAACEAMPFLADRRLVIVRGHLGRGDASGRGRASADAPLAEYVTRVPDTTDLVFLENDLPSAGAALKAIQELATRERAEIVRDAPMDETRAIEWLGRRAREAGAGIAREAAMALVGAVGMDARALDRELEKLLLLADDRPIGPEHVRALVPAADEARVFELVDAIGNRNARGAVRAWRSQMRAGEDPHRLLSMIARQVRLLIVAREHAAEGRSPAGLGSALALPPWVAQNLAGQARRWTPAALERVLATLVQLDREAKTGGQALEASLELLVAELVAGRG